MTPIPPTTDAVTNRFKELESQLEEVVRLLSDLMVRLATLEVLVDIEGED